MSRPTLLCYLLGPYYSQWLWDAETLSRVTPYEIVHLMSDRMTELYGKCRVWSVFANLGNEAVTLAEQGFQLVCSERQAQSLCRRNLENSGQVKLILDLDPFDLSAWPEVDVVILNPPWGLDYRRPRRNHFDLCNLVIGDRPFGQLFELVRARFGRVVVICPTRGVPFDRHYPPSSSLEFTKIRVLFYEK